MSNKHVNHKHGMVDASRLRPKSSAWKRRNKEKARARKEILLKSLRDALTLVSVVSLFIIVGCSHNPILKEGVPEAPQEETSVNVAPTGAPTQETTSVIVTPPAAQTQQPIPIETPAETSAPTETPAQPEVTAEPTPEQTPEPTPTPAPEPSPEPTTSQPSVKTFTLTAKQFEFSTANLTVKKGDTVRLVITSSDVTHGIAIPGYGINRQLPPNTTETIEFLADKTGTFPFACSVFCGSGHGVMRGSLTVEE